LVLNPVSTLFVPDVGKVWRECRRAAGSDRRRGEFHFSHTMEAQFGGMIDAGFVIAGFYEDRRIEEDDNPIRFHLPRQFVVRALAVDL
jgi:hypothetical protein